MPVSSPFPASVLRQPSTSARCTCEHYVQCGCACHGRHCDPSETTCALDFLPDDGGLTWWGCPSCTPGAGSPHFLGCEFLGWSVPVRGVPDSADLTPP